jgi:hypothetical protein
MGHTPHAFENQIFNHYREKAKEINLAIELLVEHNYTVVDLQGQIINKETIHNDKQPIISSPRYKKINKE